MSGYPHRLRAFHQDQPAVTGRKRPVRTLAVLAAILVALAVAATSSAHSPSRLWYRLHITYNGTRHAATTWSYYPGPCCLLTGDIVTGVSRDEHFEWSAHSKGSVLVRLVSRHGGWGVEYGLLLGDLSKAERVDGTTFQAGNWTPPPDYTHFLTECSEETTRHPLRQTTFESSLFISSGSLVPPNLFSRVLATTHTTGDLSSCQPPAVLNWPPPYPPDVTTMAALSLVPSFSYPELKKLGRHTHLALRGPNRFGASRIILHTSGSFVDPPEATPIYPRDPAGGTMTVTASGNEKVTVVLVRCPGTAPC